MNQASREGLASLYEVRTAQPSGTKAQPHPPGQRGNHQGITAWTSGCPATLLQRKTPTRRVKGAGKQEEDGRNGVYVTSISTPQELTKKCPLVNGRDAGGQDSTWTLPNLPSKCTWTATTPASKSPHSCVPLRMWLAQVSALCFPEHLLVWGILL
ncbi:hypothetical protein DV515_00003539 [Chloebia gouldiae]|uniref:Uncharacterized protein n=1 Tax=Chloebia gouldiae TaxID=44316 RepID=A0A3L8SUW9_CHLGU|nr:hypothetical protein DV515_00003539 [Chloebia gouldiae]